MKILAFGASNSRTSMNKKLASYSARKIASWHDNNANISILDLNDFEMPLYSIERNEEIGEYPLAIKFLDNIANTDLLIISFAEHNGIYTVAFKNIIDWCSRIRRDIFQNKNMILLAASVGPSGGINVLSFAEQSMPHFGGIVKGTFSIAKFQDEFDDDKQSLHNQSVANALEKMLKNAIQS